MNQGIVIVKIIITSFVLLFFFWSIIAVDVFRVNLRMCYNKIDIQTQTRRWCRVPWNA
ncbi:hypothetical protein BDV33DRAFT_121037 [Aspergillus novoparasiticus]|uniref:Uncharacterized protein n=1 Tax=Aspergillus novoparasiticus TaxID=986946 RepID=A0A5N6ELZ0_9EURO|nr:hypothetical protein BDV33DRAFT_121037 [Aspergillus novoparasiticus]